MWGTHKILGVIRNERRASKAPQMDYAESPTKATAFEGVYPQKPPQSAISEVRRGVKKSSNLLKRLAPQVGLEPTTLRLTAEC